MRLGDGEVELLAPAALALALTLGVADDELLAAGGAQLAGDAQPGASADAHTPTSPSPHHAQPSVALHVSQSGTAGHQAAAHSSATGPPAVVARHTPPSEALQLAASAGPAGEPGKHHWCGPWAAATSPQPQP